jgi:hypothetical protein
MSTRPSGVRRTLHRASFGVPIALNAESLDQEPKAYSAVPAKAAEYAALFHPYRLTPKIAVSNPLCVTGSKLRYLL